MKRRYLIEGDVQGVGFRYYTFRLAQRIGVRGWVRNVPGGRVEALGEGTAEQLGQFEAGLRRGPSMASVTKVRSEDLSDEAEGLISFEIR